MNWQALHQSIYLQGDLHGIDRPLPMNPLINPAEGVRPNSIAVAGGAFGDEGKGRIVDELCARLGAGSQPVYVYRWNGGPNAGHTVIVGGTRIALHQLPSGALHENAHILLGKGMVIHPSDLVEEIETLLRLRGGAALKLQIDEMAVLALDTHRAYEAALKAWESGGKGATGRGISPAYADVLYRHPMRVRDLASPDWVERLGRHYDLYEALIKGLGLPLAEVTVPALHRDPIPAGSREAFFTRLAEAREKLLPYVRPGGLGAEVWWAGNAPAIFEGAQAIGLDPRFGVYPDITASDPTFSGILHSTEGVVAPERIAVRAGTIKATYTSSVGTRRLPTLMDEGLAHRIREDAHEYGATTRRPRDIAHIDLPCLRFFATVSSMTHLLLTHLDIAYSDSPLRVCTHYLNSTGEVVGYRPDQDYLNRVTPQYLELPSWDGQAVQGVRSLRDLPPAALQYIAFLSGALGVVPLMGTTGPERDSMISWV